MGRIGLLGMTVLLATTIAVSVAIPASGAPGDPPDTIIDSGPSGPTNDPTPEFTFHSSEAESTFECAIDTGTPTPPFGPCPASPPQLADGSYFFRVRAINREAITDPSPATRAFTVDTVAPDTIIDSGPSGLTEDPTPTFIFHSTEAGSALECSTDSGSPAFAPCSGPTQELDFTSYTFRVRSTDAAGNTDPTPATRDFEVALPAPVYGKTVNVEPVSGVVRIRQKGKGKFSIVRTPLQVKVGTTLDASAGRVHLSSAKKVNGPVQEADFYSGIFQVAQPPTGNPITVVKLVSELGCAKGTGRIATAARSKGNGLWGSGKGNYRSEGKHGSATVRGTIWFTQDRCDGTFFRVKRGVVTVKDFGKHLLVTLHPGDTYLAQAP